MSKCDDENSFIATPVTGINQPALKITFYSTMSSRQTSNEVQLAMLIIVTQAEPV